MEAAESMASDSSSLGGEDQNNPIQAGHRIVLIPGSGQHALFLSGGKNC